jgi:hypothetical protein
LEAIPIKAELLDIFQADVINERGDADRTFSIIARFSV